MSNDYKKLRNSLVFAGVLSADYTPNPMVDKAAAWTYGDAFKQLMRFARHARCRPVHHKAVR